MAPSNLQSKHWVFTANNYDDATLAALLIIQELCTYIVYGFEVGASGTPHLQGYLVLKTRKRRNQVSSLFNCNPHLERMHGTPEQAATYCKKDGNFIEHGTLPVPASKAGGAATKETWDKYFEAAKKGDLESIPAKIRIRCYSALRRIGQDYQTPPGDLTAPTGEWHWGAPGVGKSFAVRRDFPGFYDKPLNKWWDGYQSHPNVILDDVDLKHADWLPSFLKRWADEYSFPAEMKGTTRQIRPAKVIITSNYSLSRWLESSDSALTAAVMRRFKVYHHISRDEVVEEDEPRLNMAPDVNHF